MDKEEILELIDSLCKKYVQEYVTNIKDSLMLQLVGYIEDQKTKYENTYGCESFKEVEQKRFIDPVECIKETVVHDIGGNEVKILSK